MHRSLLVIALSIAACVSPPLRAGGGGGGGAGTLATVDPSGHLQRNDSAGIVEERVAFTPLELADVAPDRWDLSLGAVLDQLDARYSRGALVAGPYAEGAWFAHAAVNGHQRWRVGPTALVELLYDTRTAKDPSVDGVGFGLAGGLLVETTERIDGPIFLGAARGELGIGVALRAGVRDFDGAAYGFAVLSLEVRAPGMLAVPVPPSATR